MSTLIELCGVARGGAILNAVKQIVSEEQRPTPALVDAICIKLPGWEPADDNEVAAAMDMLDQIADQHVASLEAAELPATDQVVTPHDAVERHERHAAEIPNESPPVVINPDAVIEALRLARIAAAESRVRITTLTNLRQAARAELSAAIDRWRVGLPKVSHLEAARAVAETQRIVRAQGGGAYRGRPGPSAIDREKFYGQGGDATTYLKKQMRRGHRRFGRGDRMLPDGRIVHVED